MLLIDILIRHYAMLIRCHMPAILCRYDMLLACDAAADISLLTGLLRHCYQRSVAASMLFIRDFAISFAAFSPP